MTGTSHCAIFRSESCANWWCKHSINLYWVLHPDVKEDEGETAEMNEYLSRLRLGHRNGGSVWLDGVMLVVLRNEFSGIRNSNLLCKKLLRWLMANTVLLLSRKPKTFPVVGRSSAFHSGFDKDYRSEGNLPKAAATGTHNTPKMSSKAEAHNEASNQ